jgi:hypothetical protein
MLTNLRRLLVLGPKTFSSIADASHFIQDESEMMETNPFMSDEDDVDEANIFPPTPAHVDSKKNEG